MKTCPKCNGSGVVNGFLHIKNGVCFCCSGTGKVSGEVIDKEDISIPRTFAYEADMFWIKEREAQEVLVNEIKEQLSMFIRIKKATEATRGSKSEYRIYKLELISGKIEWTYRCCLKHGVNTLMVAVEESKKAIAGKMYRKYKLNEGNQIEWNEVEKKYLETSVKKILDDLIKENK